MLVLINYLVTSLWWTKSVMIYSNFYLSCLGWSSSTLSARVARNAKTYSTTSVKVLVPLKADSTMWHQLTCSASKMIYAGWISMTCSWSPLVTVLMAVTDFSNSTAREFIISWLTLASHMLIRGSSAIFTSLTKVTYSPSLEHMPCTTSSGPSLTAMSDTIPAYIFGKCRWTLVTSLELPIMSNKSSSPMK